MHRDLHYISAASNYRPLSTLIADGLSDNTSPSTVVRVQPGPGMGPAQHGDLVP
jgi:hypothetical protein